MGQPSALALVFGSPASEPDEVRPPNFPYWESVSQHRFGGPSVLYLGAGWVLTARHVGLGEVVFEDKTYLPNFRSRHPLLNANGTGADVVVFKLEADVALPDLPILPLASDPPRPGEELVLIGFGRLRGKVIEWREKGRTEFRFEWSEAGAKRWGTNRVVAKGGMLPQRSWLTHVFSFNFDEPGSENTTRFEAQATVGDSGGAVFVERNGEWQLVGVMISVSRHTATPGATTQYGDVTYAADIASYRAEILRWTRPKCSNEEDDDGDGEIDFPADPGCSSRFDTDERDTGWMASGSGPLRALAVFGAGILCCAAAYWTFRARKPL